MLTSKYLLFAAGCAVALVSASGSPAVAAPVEVPTPAQAPGGFRYSAHNVVYRSSGVRLEGEPGKPALITSPQMDVAAPVIAFDLGGKTIDEVRATGGVKLRLELTPRQGSAAAHIESTSDSATLVTADRKLILTGHVQGFYQVAGGPRESLVGNQIILTYVANAPSVGAEGGNSPLMVTLPAEPTAKPGAFGSVHVTSAHFDFDGATGVGHFTGSPHAYSQDGPSKFDATANQFVLTRSAAGSIATLQAEGHSLVKIDLPPEPARVSPVPAAAVTAPAGTASVGGIGPDGAIVAPAAGAAPPAPDAEPEVTTDSHGHKVKPHKVRPVQPTPGRPTHVEALSDLATIDRETSSLTFTGHVNGFYRLSNVEPPQDFHFAGDKAVFTEAPEANGNLSAGLNVQVTDAQIESPGFNLGF